VTPPRNAGLPPPHPPLQIICGLERAELIVPLKVEKALTVTQNKLGDLWYRVGNLEAARSLYARALAIRRGVLVATGDAETRLAELDVALSLAKLADIEMVCQVPAWPYGRLFNAALL
jgi:hypothetical protein